MAHLQQVQKKTSTVSLTISSSSSSSSSSRELSSSSCSSASAFLAQRHSSLVQPLCVNSKRTQSPVGSQQTTGDGVAPSFVKCLRDAVVMKGQLVVLEGRLRGTPPLQVRWFREDEQILDSADFRILRKKASSASVPEELCTLVITEAFPQDSGLFTCVVLNPFGSVSCSALLDVYNDREEQLELEALRQQEATPLGQEEEAELQEEEAELQEEEAELQEEEQLQEKVELQEETFSSRIPDVPSVSLPASDSALEKNLPLAKECLVLVSETRMTNISEGDRT